MQSAARRREPDEFLDLVHARHSTRAFAPRPLEPSKLDAILEAARHAPSAGNLQSYRIVVVADPPSKQRLARAADEQLFLAAAGAILIFCADAARVGLRYGSRGVELYSLQDATIACAYAQLAASSLGLGSVWIGAFDEDDVRAVIGAGHQLRPVALLPIGYPAAPGIPTTRRPLSTLVRRLGR